MKLCHTLACLVALGAAGLSLGGCGRQAEQAAPPLAGARLGGPFALTDQNGNAVTDRQFAGRYRAIYFGYSYCPDVCPTTLQVLMQGYRLLQERSPATAARLAPIFITVDPERDTPAVLKTYVAAFGPQLAGLTGSPAAIARVAKEYGVYYRRQVAPAGSQSYLMGHSSQVILFGPDGAPIVLVPTDQGAKAVADTLAQWIR